MANRTSIGIIEDQATSAVVEVYPALWKRPFAAAERPADRREACLVAAWLRQVDLAGQLPMFLNPRLTPPPRTVAEVEIWILGVA